MKNNKGFVLIETIIVVSILTIGLLSLYASYVLIMRKANNSNIPNPSNSYIAHQIGTKYQVSSAYHISNKAYTEVFYRGDRYYVREGSSTGFSGSAECSEELNKLFKNLDIEKVYFIDINFSSLFDRNLLLSFDGSTIDYLNSIKNNGDINMLAEQTVVVKTNVDGKVQFSFYQTVTTTEGEPLRRTILGDSASNIGNPTTTPGVTISNTNERVLATTMDDYGLSYYFRGNVTNNYLIFADMCWRIVRITGNGAIKLVLYNQDGPECNVTGDFKAFATVGQQSSSKFNNSSSVMAGVGYMYGNDYPSATNIQEIRQNNSDSTILTYLKDWYDDKFSYEQRQLIADVIWCNDKSFAYGNGSSTSAEFGGNMRIQIEHTPNLLCPTIPGQDQISRFTSNAEVGNGELAQYKIGLLTADEVAFAGGSYDSNNTSYYLYANAKGHWWTMTPNFYNSGTATVFEVTSNGSISRTSVGNAGYVRPAIALTPSIEVLGAGTASNPYIVTE